MNVYTMPGVAEMGMVWMGAGQPSEMAMGLISNENGDSVLDHDNPYFTPSHNSASNQSLDDMTNVHGSPMDMDHMDMLTYDDIKQESNDGSYLDDDSSAPVYMITTSTQTVPCSTRKIQPIKHPGLVLKTPIAYQSDTDPSVIPIQKDGIAVCEKCGAIGVKHAFYTKERRFCSMACARGYSGLVPEPISQSIQTNNSSTQEPTESNYSPHQFKMEMLDDFTGLVNSQPLPQIPPPPPSDQNVEDNTFTVSRRKNTDLANSHDWEPQFSDSNFIAAPVTCFKHVPISDIWSNILVGMKVEVENTDCDNMSDAFPDSFWVATVIKIIGYKALLRYEGFGVNETKDFWISLCSNQVHPVGWCATRGKPLIPPKTIEDKYNDWKEFLCKRLTGARTLPSNFSNKVSDGIKSRFHCGLHLEVVDKNRISQVKVAMVHKIVGKRLNVKYYDMPVEDPGFWCHEDSSLIHPVGWAKKVGHHLVAPVDYLERTNEGIWDDDDATEDLFTLIQVGSKELAASDGFSVGMKLEAIDPLNLSSICAATVMDVLRYGYIMIRIDTYESDATGGDWFCYHMKSPCIFPIGFCNRNNIPLTPPNGYGQANFTWKNYLKETKSIPVPPMLLQRNIPPHGFQEGMKLEAADLMEPQHICVATVSRVVGRLLRVQFDGWSEEYDQWLDCESPDIYPVGWCQSMNHRLERPNNSTNPPVVTRSPKAVRKKAKKKKYKTTHLNLMKNWKVNHTKPEVKNEQIDVVLEPVTAEEPVGPDQNMPVSTEPQPPLGRKVTSYINTTNNTSSTKLIPRLVDSSGGNCESGELCPGEWNVFDVAQFLRVNDCANYCDNFSKQKIDGKMLFELSKEDILEYTGGKVGPSLKIYDLIQQLKLKINPTKVRLMKGNIKKFL